MRLQAIECHEQYIPTGLPLPPFFDGPAGLHAWACHLASDQFGLLHGTDELVPSLCTAIYAKQRLVRFWPLNWRNEQEKGVMLDAMRAVFSKPEWRPDRYCYQGEVWVASMTPEEAASGIRPKDHPNMIDGLVILTVDPAAEQVVRYTAYVRNSDGEVEPHAKQDDPSLEGFKGRLAELMEPTDVKAEIHASRMFS